jgi:hypothetical protein
MVAFTLVHRKLVAIDLCCEILITKRTRAVRGVQRTPR